MRAKEEESAQIVLADAGRGVKAAEEELAAKQERLRRDERARGKAADWELAESARMKAISDAKKAAVVLADARAVETRARDRYIEAHRKVEVVRRAADRKREEIARDGDAKDRKEMDQVANLLYSFNR